MSSSTAATSGARSNQVHIRRGGRNASLQPRAGRADRLTMLLKIDFGANVHRLSEVRGLREDGGGCDEREGSIMGDATRASNDTEIRPFRVDVPEPELEE